MSKWIRAGQKGWGAITGVKPGTKFKGQSTVETIKKKSKKFKNTMVDETKAEFKKKPWKDPKKEWDQALREYVEKKK